MKDINRFNCHYQCTFMIQVQGYALYAYYYVSVTLFSIETEELRHSLPVLN